MKRLKSKAITKVLTLLGFSSAAFVFTACYGARPVNYSEEEADSISVAFTQTETDSIEATQPASDAEGDKAADAR